MICYCFCCPYHLHRCPQPGIYIIRIMLGGAGVAAFVAETYDDGVEVGNDEYVLSEDASHVWDLHAVVGQMPELESVAAVCFVIFFE